MKKAITFVVAFAMLLSLATVASAAENTTTLTTTVPAATYTMNIPADQKIEFGSTETIIGNVTVPESSGFANGKNLKVTITWEDFTCNNVSTTIPFLVYANATGGNRYSLNNGGSIFFEGGYGTSLSTSARHPGGTYFVDNLSISVSSEAWGKALAGEYSATITFTAEVVVDN